MRRRRQKLILLMLPALLAGCNADSRQLQEQADARWREGNYEDAIRLNRLLHDTDPRGPFGRRALLNIGNIYYLNLRQIHNAIETYQMLVGELPGGDEEFEAREKLAQIYVNEVGDLTQAIYEYEKILAWEGLDRRAEIRLQLANAYFQLEDYDRALRELRKIEEEATGGHIIDQVRLKIGNIYQLRKRYEDAVEPYLKVSESPCIECRRRALLNLMETYESTYNFEKAIEAVLNLDRTPENEERISREVTRLSEKRDMLESGTLLPWEKRRMD